MYVETIILSIAIIIFTSVIAVLFLNCKVSRILAYILLFSALLLKIFVAFKFFDLGNASLVVYIIMNSFATGFIFNDPKVKKFVTQRIKKHKNAGKGFKD